MPRSIGVRLATEAPRQRAGRLCEEGSGVVAREGAAYQAKASSQPLMIE